MEKRETTESKTCPSVNPGAAIILVDPSSKLPDEILSAIFEETVAELENISPIPHLLVEFLRTITLVSRRWYIVATRAPRLWRNIVLGPDSLPAKLCVQRSGAVALNIRADNTYGSAGPSLTRCLSYVQVATRLKRLDVSMLGVKEQAFISSREWTNLKSLSLRHCSIGACSELISLLGHAQSLQYIYFYRVSCRDFGSRATEFAYLPRLEQIELLDTSENNARAVLRSIRAPIARQLLIRLILKPSAQPPSPYDITSGAWDSVTDLSFGGLHLRSQDILQLLPHTPCVVSIALFQVERWAVDFDDFLYSLAAVPGRGGSTAAPRLHTLALYKIRFSFTALRLLVENRIHSDTPIKSIGLKSIKSVWYFNHDFQLLKKQVELFEWTPRHTAESEDDDEDDEDYA